MLTALLIALAAACNALMDTISHHFDTSVLRSLNREFWNPEQYPMGGAMLPHTRYRVNAWHLAKSAMIGLLCLAVVTHHGTLAWWWELPLAGVVWNGAFNLCYNRIFRKKPS